MKVIKNCGSRNCLWRDYIRENILPMSVLEWEVNRVGCKIYGKKELQARESRNSLAEKQSFVLYIIYQENCFDNSGY